LLNQTKT